MNNFTMIRGGKCSSSPKRIFMRLTFMMLFALFGFTEMWAETSTFDFTKTQPGKNEVLTSSDKNVTFTISDYDTNVTDGLKLNSSSILTINSLNSYSISEIAIETTMTSSKVIFNSSTNGVNIGQSSDFKTYTVTCTASSTTNVVLNRENNATLTSIKVTYTKGGSPVEPGTITIDPQPGNKECKVGKDASLSIAAIASNGNTCSYQWYSCDDASKNNAQLISGANGTTYSPVTTTVGTTYYYCVVSAKDCDNVESNAVSVKVTGYAITYVINDHGTQPDNVTDATALPNELPKLEAEGWIFGGWYTDEALTTAAVAGTTIDKDVMLYAKWTENAVVTDGLIEEFTLPGTFDEGRWKGDKGTGMNVSPAAYNSKGYVKLTSNGSTSLDVPQGYTVSKIVLTVKSDSKEDTEITIKGINKTIPGSKYTDIEYDITDVVGPNKIVIKNIGAKVALITGIKVYGTAPAAGETFSIDYITAHGKAPESQANVSTLKAEYLPVLTADGYVFEGWYTDEACTEENKAVAETTLEADITLYAKWTIDANKSPIVLQYYVTKGGKDNYVLEGSSSEIGTTLSPTLKAFIANADGTASDVDVTEKIKSSVTFKSDMESFVTVNGDGSVITITDGATGGAKIYATFAGNEKYAAAETFFNVIITSGYSYKVKDGDKAPGVRTTKVLQDKDGKDLLKITFGGWKLGDGDKGTAYKIPGSTGTKTDSWGAAETETDIASIDGYNYFFQGTNDAKDEAIEEGEFYGATRYGWFVPRDKGAEGTAGGTHPFTLPVRGSYVTFEPTMNGTLTVYILQNGAWNTDKKSHKIIKGEFRTHSFHVVNQRGLPVKYFSQNGYSVTTKQTVDENFTCDLTKIDDPVDNNSTNIALWDEFRTKFDKGMQEEIQAAWKGGPNGAQEIIELKDHSFLAIQKGIVKYTFHVMAKETYYFFSNFSKMGFSGVNFVPDTRQPNETDYPTLTLSDTEKYVAPEKGDDGYYVDGQLCFEVNSDNPIGGEDVVQKVPQFAKITVNREFKAGQWTTLSLPFNIMGSRVEEIFGKGTEIIMLDKATIDNGVAHLHFIYHEIQNILPGYPYLIKPKNTISSFTITDKYINPAMAQVEIVCGDYTAKCVNGYSTGDVTNSANGKTGYSVNYKDGDIFVSEGDGKLYVSSGQSYGKGYRSYIEKKVGTQAVKSISMTYSGVADGDHNTPTEIKFVELAPEAVKALGFKGVYNLNGQRVGDTTENLPAGVYIENGRKVVIK